MISYAIQALLSNSKINIIFAKMDLKLIEKTRMEFEISFC